MTKEIAIALVDDHNLYRRGLAELIKMLDSRFKITAEYNNGQQLIDALPTLAQLPDLLILDIDMPVMNGYETLEALQAENIKLPALIVTMVSEEASLIRMVKLGARGYLSKEIEPDELQRAIVSVVENGYYLNDMMTGRLLFHAQNNQAKDDLGERDLQFIRLCCSELTYSEIADKMNLSPKTIDGYRAKLFERFEVKSRVGLVLLAVKKKWLM